MPYVIQFPDGSLSFRSYVDQARAEAAMVRRGIIGAAVWWCRYGRECKVVVSAYERDAATGTLVVVPVLGATAAPVSDGGCRA
jgi:hypothetical protein